VDEVVLFGAAIGIGANWIIVCVMLLNLTLFYFAQWEEYHRGILELGYFNVTEAQIVVIIHHMISFFLGSKFWLNTISLGPLTLSYNQISFVTVVFSFFGTATVNFRNVMAEIANKKLNAIHVYGQLIPVLICDFCLIVWVSFTDVLKTHPHQLLLCYGLIMAVLVGKVVFARVCSMHFSTFQPVTLIMILVALNSYFGGFAN